MTDTSTGSTPVQMNQNVTFEVVVNGVAGPQKAAQAIVSIASRRLKDEMNGGYAHQKAEQSWAGSRPTQRGEHFNEEARKGKASVFPPYSLIHTLFRARSSSKERSKEE